ncbi:MAG: ABC transporter ATP-binding protein [Desulfobacterota bacterium]|nr:ABC transporter ATP-binding protein [Thermodesulfobacteriota bacterium]MDW8002088.1 ABC transporter ATP-binding protein [Deltaproteobacteria bacterium]
MLLEIRNLSVSVLTDLGYLDVIEDVSFGINEGEIYGLVGESGCGKTVTALSILKLLGDGFKIKTGSIIFKGQNLLSLEEKEIQKIRGRQISIVFQEPMTSLNPVIKVGEQIGEMLKIHLGLDKKTSKERAIELLRRVGFENPEKRYHQYPHQLSGGQRQRVLIAIAISLRPSLIICDEPTTALDVASEWEVLSILLSLVKEEKMAMLFITHDLHLIEKICDRIGIMYLGRIVEEQKKEDFFRNPLHPYSQGLLNSALIKGEELKPIRGSVPDLRNIPHGCKFHPRCDFSRDVCLRKEPELLNQGDGRWVRCFLYGI